MPQINDIVFLSFCSYYRFSSTSTTAAVPPPHLLVPSATALLPQSAGVVAPTVQEATPVGTGSAPVGTETVHAGQESLPLVSSPAALLPQSGVPISRFNGLNREPLGRTGLAVGQLAKIDGQVAVPAVQESVPVVPVVQSAAIVAPTGQIEQRMVLQQTDVKPLVAVGAPIPLVNAAPLPVSMYRFLKNCNRF